MFASLWVAYALWAVLGLFGAHRFYVGRPASGVVWLLTGGLFGIGWIIDFFLLPDFVCVSSPSPLRAPARTLQPPPPPPPPPPERVDAPRRVLRARTLRPVAHTLPTPHPPARPHPACLLLSSRPARSGRRSRPPCRRAPLPCSEEHNKKVFHQQMVETGSTLLYNGDYAGGGGMGGGNAYYSDGGHGQFGAAAPYAQAQYYPQDARGGGGYGQGYDQPQRGAYGRY